jgi:hypothetical protein
MAKWLPNSIVIIDAAAGVCRNLSIALPVSRSNGLFVRKQQHDKALATWQNAIWMPVSFPASIHVRHLPRVAFFQPLQESHIRLRLLSRDNSHRVESQFDGMVLQSHGQFVG